MKELNNYNSVIDYIRVLDSSNNQNDIALEYYGNKIARKDYWQYIDKYRRYFYSLGVDKGDSVAICMLNSPEYEFIFAALLENGSIASTVSKSFLNADIKRQTTERGIKTLVLSVEFLPELIKNGAFMQFDKLNCIERIILTSSEDFKANPNYAEFEKYNNLISGLDFPKSVEIIVPSKLKRGLEKCSSVILPSYNLMDSVATYSNTGGTTGAPKCAFHTHRAIASLIKSHDKKIFREFNLKDKSRSLLVIPISHITSQFYALLLRRAYGANIIYNPNVFEPNVLREELIKESIDDVVLPFGLYYAITRQPIEKGKLRLNTPACGGEPTPYVPTVDVNNRLHAAGSESIIIGTGSTEFGSGIMGTYGVENRSNESGYFFPYAKGFLLDPSSNSVITEPGKRGILYASAPWQMTGYLNDEAATQNFYNYNDSEGNLYGTNNDIAEIVGEHNGQPLYSMLGRISDFVLHTEDKKYYPGITLSDGKVSNINFDDGDFLFDMRDVLLNTPGVMEAQPIIVPLNQNTKEGYPVINITINRNYDAESILKQAYEAFNSKGGLIPTGIIFRTRFERSLSSDKREVISLTGDRCGYYYYDGTKVYAVSLPQDGVPVLSDCDGQIETHEPPAPRLVYSSIKKTK